MKSWYAIGSEACARMSKPALYYDSDSGFLEADVYSPASSLRAPLRASRGAISNGICVSFSQLMAELCCLMGDAFGDKGGFTGSL